MANEENLIPNSERTPSELREITKKGGKASGKARRERKAMKETLNILLSMPLARGKEVDLDKVRSFADIDGKNVTIQTAMMAQMIQRALTGDIAAATFIRDTSGQKPAINKYEEDDTQDTLIIVNDLENANEEDS